LINFFYQLYSSDELIFWCSRLCTISLFTWSKQKWLFRGPRVFSGKSGLFENFSDCSDWLDKNRHSKKATFVLIM